MNLALLRVLSLPEMGGLAPALAAAARVLFGGPGGLIITLLALISCLGLINAVVMAAPRVLYGLSRDGLGLPLLTEVNAGGTPVAGPGPHHQPRQPRWCSWATSPCCWGWPPPVCAPLRHRHRLPGGAAVACSGPAQALPDPGYPFTALTVGLTSVAFLVGALWSDTRNSLLAVGLILLSVPLHWLLQRQGPLRAAE